MSALYHEVHGSGEAGDLVLLHGWSLNLRVWDGLVRELAPRLERLELATVLRSRGLRSKRLVASPRFAAL